MLISAFAKAANLVVADSMYQPKQNLILVHGQYSGICLSHVRPSLVVENGAYGPQFKLDLLAKEICPSQLKNYKFEMAIDARSLGLPERSNVALGFNHPTQKRLGGPMIINNQSSFPFDYKDLILINGQIVALDSGDYGIVLKNNELMKLDGAFDYSKYVGTFVTLKGFEMNYKIQPIAEPFAELTSMREVKQVKKFIALAIFSLN